ncbi:halocarboxylic acid dehydrogenase DehI family protein [Litchfieldia alkalitelluris]|uniref:halocarboxylic acid dehydrogenase DehI family protein n=1 Tax=Litchfieldia alkalitelluris TaxID=304268 RepID=UPI000997DA66|nr:halocarboxylic acid dehydrogenase DehI family protein [Litchfieldia alkalitelluris]
MHNSQFGIPEIFDNQDTGKLATLYNDIKFVLKVPIVNFVFRTLAHYDQFLTLGWNQVRTNLLTQNMEDAAAQLRYPHLSFNAPQIKWNQFYPKETIDRIKGVLLVFNYVNPKLLLMTISWEEALGYRPITGGKKIEGFIQAGIFPGFPKPHMIDIPSADYSTKVVLKDIIDTKNSYDAASDYRALACFPGFLEKTWPSLKEVIKTEEYTLLGHELKENARKLVHELSPYPIRLTSEYLQTVYSPGEVAGIMGIISMFSNFIANLIIDGECFRRIVMDI